MGNGAVDSYSLGERPPLTLAPVITKQSIEALRKHRVVKKWLKGKSKRTQNDYLRILARLTMQVEDSPEWIIRSVKKADPAALRELINESPPESRSALRTFFKANGVVSPKLQMPQQRKRSS
jgi:hypothetical protein